MDSTPGVTSADYEAHLWQGLLNLANYAISHLDEAGCFRKDEQMYFENLEKAARDLFNQAGEDKKAQAKTLIVEMLGGLVDVLLGCG